MITPEYVTVDSNGDLMFWADYDHALKHVQLVGGEVTVIPETVENDLG